MSNQSEHVSQEAGGDDPRVFEALRERIGERGSITFAEFMDCVLYSAGGYYASGRAGGRDYRTSPHVHPLFAALLCLQLEQVWALTGHPRRFDVMEAGGGDGELGRQIVSYARHLETSFADSLHYVIVEPFGQPSVESQPGLDWLLASALALPFEAVVGCVISNELIDAFPVHRVCVRNGYLQEVVVTYRDGKLEEVFAEPGSPELEQYFQRLGFKPREGAIVEVNLGAARFIGEASRVLERGFVLTIDYGKTAEDLYLNGHQAGTLRCFRRHTCVSDPFSHLGHQDITADIDFSSLVLAGREAGLKVAGATTQRDLLLNLGFEAFANALDRSSLDAGRRYDNKFAAQELINRSGLGAYRVLAQYRGLVDAEIDGLHPYGAIRRELVSGARRLPLPLMLPE